MSSKMKSVHGLLVFVFLCCDLCAALKMFEYSFATVSTATVTTTSTFVTLTRRASYCAKLVNVTAACRRRRGMWIDEPEVMSFDGDSDAIDEILRPSKVQSSESSKAPKLNHRTERGLFSRRMGSLSPSSPEDLQSSLREEISPEDKTLLLLKKKKKRKGHALVTLEKLDTVTTTTTSYLTCYSTTNTFFVQGCTPSPFPFVTCP